MSNFTNSEEIKETIFIAFGIGISNDAVYVY